MALAWFGEKRAATLAELIAKKQYAKAIELLRLQFGEGNRDPRMRMQLADVLVFAGRKNEAAPILMALADEYALEGFVAKAVAVLKKLEKVDPGRADVERRLAKLVQEKRVDAAPPPLPGGPELGMEEIALEPHPLSAATVSAAPPEPSPASELSEAEFEQEFFGVLQESLRPQAGGGAAGQAAASAPQRRVTSPLFDDFTEEELLAVIQKLALSSFAPGDIIISEGEPGDSLFVLTTGAVKAFVRNPSGRQVLVREMEEGSFFGEISILSGKPRTATITCATPAELLELDRKALDEITVNHPRVQQVLLDFYRKRAGSSEETLVRGMAFGAQGQRS
jgi:hypothetical protein